MKSLPQSLVLCFGVLALIGCPGGDDDDSSESDRDESDGGIDEGDNAGKGAGGKSGAAAGEGGITADQVAVCRMMSEMGAAGVGATQCTGIEDYTKCADETCGSADCYEGDCKDLLDCYQDADDPCNADCTPSADCNACLSDVARCAAEECVRLVMCGETEAGGACDQLDDCCESKSDSAKMACKVAAETSRSGGGDKLCETILTNLCPE